MTRFRPISVARLMSFSVTSFVPAARSAPSLATPPHLGLPHTGPFLKSAVRVQLSTANNRRIHPNSQVEDAIEQLWAGHKTRAPRIFNGTKLRLHRWHVNSSTAVGSSPVLELQCGLTDYKSYLGTCCSDSVVTLRRDGEKLHGGDAHAFLSRKIGVSAIVETSDSRVALIERSQSVGVYQHLFDTPGGHPEPSAIPLTLDDLIQLETSDAIKKEQLQDTVRDQLFQSIVDEVREEINLSAALIAEPLLLGVVWQSVAETPSFVFHLQTDCSSADVDALYQQGPQDKFESTQLQWVDDTPLTPSYQLTPAAQGSLSLWRQYTAFRAAAAQ